MTTPFFSLPGAKRILTIDDGDDDAILAEFGDYANADLENFLRGFYPNLPIASIEITDDMQAAANYDVARQYKIRTNNFDGADQFKNLRDEKRELIKSSLLNNVQTQSSWAIKF